MRKLIRRVIVLYCTAVRGSCASRCFCLMNLAAGTASQNANDAPAQEKTQHPGLRGRDKYCPCIYDIFCSLFGGTPMQRCSHLLWQTHTCNTNTNYLHACFSFQRTFRRIWSSSKERSDVILRNPMHLCIKIIFASCGSCHMPPQFLIKPL